MVDETDLRASHNRLQTETLLHAIDKHRFDVVFGGARRDEETARAKERIFSFRDEFGQWDPKNQRPEIWDLYNARHRLGEDMRVFPISNWTEMDVWQYIEDENIKLPTIYFAHRRRVFERDGMLTAESPYLQPIDGEEVFEATVRFRTVGRHDLHRSLRIHRVVATRDHRRGGGHPDLRAGGQPRRRQDR